MPTAFGGGGSGPGGPRLVHLKVGGVVLVASRHTHRKWLQISVY